MGEIADLIINGEQCHYCGVMFQNPHGYPVCCRNCYDRGEELPMATEPELPEDPIMPDYKPKYYAI